MVTTTNPNYLAQIENGRNESINFIMCIFVCARLYDFDLWHKIIIQTL